MRSPSTTASRRSATRSARTARPGRFDVDDGRSSRGAAGRGPRRAAARERTITLDDGRVVWRRTTCSAAARRGRAVVLTGDTAPCASVVEAAAGRRPARPRGDLPRRRARTRDARRGTRPRPRRRSSRARPACGCSRSRTSPPATRPRGRATRRARCSPRHRRAAGLRRRAAAVPRARRPRARRARRAQPPRPGCTLGDMSDLVQVSAAGNVAEAEELERILAEAGITATLRGAADEHPEGHGDGPMHVLVPADASRPRATRSRRSPSRTTSSTRTSPRSQVGSAEADPIARIPVSAARTRGRAVPDRRSNPQERIRPLGSPVRCADAGHTPEAVLGGGAGVGFSGLFVRRVGVGARLQP